MYVVSKIWSLVRTEVYYILRHTNLNGGSIPPTSTNRGVADMQRYTCPTNNGGFT